MLLYVEKMMCYVGYLLLECTIVFQYMQLGNNKQFANRFPENGVLTYYVNEQPANWQYFSSLFRQQ